MSLGPARGVSVHFAGCPRGGTAITTAKKRTTNIHCIIHHNYSTVSVEVSRWAFRLAGSSIVVSRVSSGDSWPSIWIDSEL